MRLNYTFSLACGLALTNAVSAQVRPPTPPTTTPPATTPPATTPPQSQPGQALPAQPNPYPNALYRMNDVSKSLNLTPDQITNLNKLTDQTQAQHRDNYNKLNTLNNVDQFSRLQELNRQYNGDWNRGARNIFNDNQWSRYQQLNHQYGGFNSLYDPDVQKQLSLSPNQIKNLDEQRTWSNQQLQEINRIGATDPTKGAQMYRDYWSQYQDRFNKYLTPAQQKTWLQMTGEPYTFQPSFTPNR